MSACEMRIAQQCWGLGFIVSSSIPVLLGRPVQVQQGAIRVGDRRSWGREGRMGFCSCKSPARAVGVCSHLLRRIIDPPSADPWLWWSLYPGGLPPLPHIHKHCSLFRLPVGFGEGPLWGDSKSET